MPVFIIIHYPLLSIISNGAEGLIRYLKGMIKSVVYFGRAVLSLM